MGRRNLVKERCSTCFMHTTSCICELITPFELDTRVVVLMHALEAPKPTNTGRLAQLFLKNSETRIRGALNQPFTTDGLIDEKYQSLILFPYEEALELNHETLKQFKRPLRLIVPDGTWRQATKMVPRERSLDSVMRIKLPEGGPSAYRLRQETRSGGMATFEAIARAIGIIHGPKYQRMMEHVFQIMVQRTLVSRGMAL